MDLKITADYHTHTTYSHGKGSIADNALVASQKGLEILAITDHGARQPAVGVSPKKFDVMRKDLEEVQSHYKDLKLILGIEANIMGVDGDLDISDEDAKKLDIVIAGYHYMAMPYKFIDNFRINFNVLTKYTVKSTKAQIARNTSMFVKAVKRHKIDILTHPGFKLDVDYDEIAKVCSDYGTYVELSSRHRIPDDDSIGYFLARDCQFVLNSDAHKSLDVGNCDFARSLVERCQIPSERIANIDGKRLVLRSKS